MDLVFVHLMNMDENKKRKDTFIWLIHHCNLTLTGWYVHIFIACVYKYIWCKYSAMLTSYKHLGSFESIAVLHLIQMAIFTPFSGQWWCSFYLYNSDEDFQLIHMQLQVHTVCQPGAQKIHCAGVPLLKHKYIVLQQRQTHIQMLPRTQTHRDTHLQKQQTHTSDGSRSVSREQIMWMKILLVQDLKILTNLI